MTVTPFGDTPGVSKQLRLVEAPVPARTRRRTTDSKRGRANPRRPGRRTRWDIDWRIDASTRTVGRAGVAAARDALTRASDQDLREAS